SSLGRMFAVVFTMLFGGLDLDGEMAISQIVTEFANLFFNGRGLAHVFNHHVKRKHMADAIKTPEMHIMRFLHVCKFGDAFTKHAQGRWIGISLEKKADGVGQAADHIVEYKDRYSQS